ncbi:MAG: hypothetical protein SGI72_02780 [Planctomycetota bacterium]|nr:hypothetical protein [Planctomycetota bacterium]
MSLATASAWLERVLDSDATGDAALSTRDPRTRRIARLNAALALARVDADSATVARVRMTIVRDQRSDGGFDAEHAAVAADAATTAACVEILALNSVRSRAEEQALARAILRLRDTESAPNLVRALVAIAEAEGVLERLRSAARDLESEFELHALQPLADVREAADRLHAWHAAAAVLNLDFRRHPAVQQCTQALIQRVEASAGEVRTSYAKDERIPSPSADGMTSTRTALALFAVTDAIVGPRAAFAAELVVDALVARVRDGAVRRSPTRFAKRCVIATALFVEALCCSQARARIPWAVLSAPAESSRDALPHNRRA